MRSLRLSVAAAVLIVAGMTLRVAALYEIPETKKVPVARLVENLERTLAADPKNVEVRINLARLHGMAYALKTDEVDAALWRRNAEYEPYYGHNRDLIPYKALAASTPAARAEARAHLTEAIAQYEAALAIDPRSLLARLGHGWTLDQAGQKARAVDEYRQVVKEAWTTEEDAERRLPEDRFFTYEAAGYLIPLLDPDRDAAEIADLRAKRKFLSEKRARAITPLAIPLDDDVRPEEIVAPAARIRFDADGSGLPRYWNWISPRAGWLVHDPGQRGSISSALQWFGNVTFWLFWRNGYHALAALDDNGDGELTGPELRDLAIWHDRNSNGISEPGEIQPLSAHAIVALSCRFTDGDHLEFAAVSNEGVRLANGRTRPSYDVLLRRMDVRLLTRR